MRFTNATIYLCAVSLGLFTLTPSVEAESVKFVGIQTNADNEVVRHASAKFETNGANPNELKITLSNLAPATTQQPFVLNALFFDIVNLDGSASLTPLSATVAAGSKLVYDYASFDSNVGGAWAYGKDWEDSGARNAFNSQVGHDDVPYFALSSVGLDPFGEDDLIDDAVKNNQPNGPDYGLVGVGTDAETQMPQAPFIEHELEVIIAGLGSDFDITQPWSHIANVHFWYGTDFSEGTLLTSTIPLDGGIVVPTPTASSAGVAMMLLMGFCFAFSRARHHQRVLEAC